MPLSIRIYNFPICGLSIDWDLNAARNIKAFGLAKLVEQETIKILETYRVGITRINAHGDTSNGGQVVNWSSYVSVKQEATPTEVGVVVH
jgi:hypothetical protein